MIGYHAVVDSDGWVQQVACTEGRRRPGRVPLTAREFHTALLVEGLRHGPEGLELAQDDRVAWKCLRRFRTGSDAVSRLTTLREHRAVFGRDLSLPVPDPPPLMAPGTPPADAFPGVPGLTLEPMQAGHLNEAAAIAVEAGLVAAICPDGQCQPPEAHAWLELASRLDRRNQWQFALSFEGRPLQYEVITFDPLHTTATFAITYHTSAGRERPSWFHHEAEQPVFAALQQLGIRTLLSRTRSDRPDWIASLKATYGAVERGMLTGGVTQLEFPLDLSRFAGWPLRDAGGDLTIGVVTYREGAPTDFPAVEALIDADLAPERAAFVKQGMRERYHLDRATLLLGYVGGQFEDARMIRRRRGTTGSVFQLSRASKGALDVPLARAQAAWARRQGYTSLSRFIPASLYDHPDIQASLAATKATVVAQHTRFKEPFVEVEIDVTRDP